MAMEVGLHEADAARGFDMRALWRLAGWGVAAALSLAVLAVTTRSDIGSQRLKLAFAPAPPPEQPVAVVRLPPRIDDADLARLQAQVRALTADRERLTERVASLEHSFDDLTGSIKQQVEAAATAAQAKAAAAAPVIAPPAMASRQAPETEARGTSSRATRDEQAEVAAPRQTETAMAEPARAVEPAPQRAAPLRLAPRHVTVPLPPERVAALPPKPGFGISLAGATSVALLHMQWGALKANFAPLLGELKPYVLREKRGIATHYRLIVGPMPTYTAAAKLCARLIKARAVCHPVRMAGEPL